MLSRCKAFTVPALLVVATSFLAGQAVRRHSGEPPSPSKGLMLAKLSHGFGLADADLAPVDVFAAVLESVRKDYVERLSASDSKKLTYGALRNMVEALNDPYSLFLTPAQRKMVEEAQEGKFHGLGAVVLLKRAKHKDLVYERLVVASVVPGGPAHKAGVMPGDVVTKIGDKHFFQIPSDIQREGLDIESLRDLYPPLKANEKPREFIDFREAMEVLGKDGQTVRLELERAGSSTPVAVSVPLGAVTVDLVQHRLLEPGVGYLRIVGFAKGSREKVRAALNDLSSQGAKGLVLDLRDCIGGPLEDARAVAGEFLTGNLGFVEKAGGQRRPLKLDDADRFSGRLVVLVNSATLGSAELLAGAIADAKAGSLVGTPTFGDGLDQTLIPLSDGAGLQLTTGKLVTPSGKDFNQKGIAPHVVLPGDPSKQLAKATELAKSAA